MPLAKIEVRKSRPAAEKAALMRAVYEAQRAALNLREGDTQVRYIEHAPGDWLVPAAKTEAFTVVEVTLYPGRTLDMKRKFYDEIARRFAVFGIGADDLYIVLHEVPSDNWGLRGKPGSEQ